MQSRDKERKVAFSVEPAGETRTAELDREPPWAIFVAHGMGQQVPFETLNSVAQGLLNVTGGGGPWRTRTVVSGCERLQRLELDLTIGGVEREVHVYEAYWAPLTEGVVGIIDVLRFLFSAGKNGLACATKSFVRWIFGGLQTFVTPRVDVIYLLTALAVVAALVIINSVIGAVAAARFAFENSGWLTDHLLRDLTTTFELLILLVVTFVVFLVISTNVRGRRLRSVLHWPLVTMFVVLLGSVIVTGLAGIPVLLYCHLRAGSQVALLGAWTWLQHAIYGIGGLVLLFAVAALLFALSKLAISSWSKSDAGARTVVVLGLAFFAGVAALLGVGIWRCSDANTLASLEWALIFAFLAAISTLARSFLIQYVGDVAAYVQSHKVDRFYELRTRVKAAVWRTMRAVYAFRTGGALLYENIIVVGH
jgi:hypothetical protein